jgi:polar amino acid transport system substrate-binding protein
MYAGIGFFAYFVAQLSSSLTLQKLKSGISSPADLQDKPVATVEASSSVPILQSLGAIVTETPQIEQAYEKLLAGEVEAVVFDSPNLLYYAQREGQGKVSIVGPLFDPQDYGVAFPEGSPLRERVNRALLKLQKSGKYDEIYRKWFGEPEGSLGRLSAPGR